MQLVDGAEAIAGDLPRSACVRVDVPLEAGDSLGSAVHRLSTLQQVRRQLEAVLDHQEEQVLIVGGDCSVSIGGIGYAARRHHRLAVVWADAHPDLHSPVSSPSHAFSGMALRAALGEGPDGLRLPEGTVLPADVVLLGARSFDDAEEGYIDAYGIRSVSVDDLADPDALARAVQATGADAVYVHVDVDVLDPEQMPGVKSAEPFGARVTDLIAALKRLRETVPLAGASLTEFVPASPEADPADMGTLLRLVGALA
jgi:arginase